MRLVLLRSRDTIIGKKMVKKGFLRIIEGWRNGMLYEKNSK